MEPKKRKRDMWKNIPWQRRKEIEKQINDMKPGLRKEILKLAFIDGMSTADIERFANNVDWLHSRNHRPISKRRVLQIIAEEIPDYNKYQIHKDINKRSEHFKFIWKHEKKQCAFCGKTENLEWHHMIPIFLGGTTEIENMVCACHQCHSEITKYQRKLYPEKFATNKNSAESKNSEF